MQKLFRPKRRVRKSFLSRPEDRIWRRHIIVLLPGLFLPFLYGASWVAIGIGFRRTGEISLNTFLMILFIGMLITVPWARYRIGDWKDEVYILSRKKNALVREKRHPFVFESSQTLPRDNIGFTAAQIGKSSVGSFSVKAFIWWLTGCGRVNVYGPGAKIEVVFEDVFLPERIKNEIDRWLRETGE